MEVSVNVIDEIPEPHRSTLMAVLQDKEPDLLEALRSGTVPNYQELRVVEDAMITAMSDHFLPGHEPDETGKAIDNALGAFFLRWPSDKLAGSP
jgi:hypothetical protein